MSEPRIRAHTIQRRRSDSEARWQRGWVNEAAAPRKMLRSRSLRSTWELPGRACSHGNDLRQAGWMPSWVPAVMRDWKIWPVTDTRSHALRRRGRTRPCPQQICGVVCMGWRCAAQSRGTSGHGDKKGVRSTRGSAAWQPHLKKGKARAPRPRRGALPKADVPSRPTTCRPRCVDRGRGRSVDL